ncbi:phytoene desaturase family protein [Chitinophaga rhizosphaerae]|uniref:phytoene desaturase family protein n=1 Tax=Chitinophaga rhizosphaerae TaxID=1864947 RepID=UPI000F80D8E2|nr:phytoene desaturase family protein [Chitinophaga rhizosphaerae]
MQKKIAIIGSGISGLSAAAYAAKAGHEVHVFEKNGSPGGRARQLAAAGYTFDMGPSWYWMPDVIERFFRDFGSTASDYYELVPLDPQFEIIFSDGNLAVPREYGQLRSLFESLEPGAGRQLDAFMKSARFKYEVGMREFVQKPCHSWLEFVSPRIAVSSFKLDLLSGFRKYVDRYFKNSRLAALMEFPVIFLGAPPSEIPAMYSLMNYGGLVLGTWYPMGGFYQLVLAMKSIAEKEGARFYFNSPVERIVAENGRVTSIIANGQQLAFDAVIASSDYHHTETLLDTAFRNYDEAYWRSRTFAPSSLIYYLGFNQRLPRLQHHNLFFEHPLDGHIDDIYKNKRWPQQPLFYACCPSKTDPAVAPAGHENLFLLMPLATGLHDEEAIRERYLDEMLHRLEKHTGMKKLRDKIDFTRSYCVRDFIQDYNAYQGNAYGLANTLAQTAVGKPALRNRKLCNLFYAGQLTVPGPGVPPSVISGKIAANEINQLKSVRYESAF